MSLKKLSSIIAVLSLGLSTSVSANLITNGSFEDPGLNPGQWTVFNPEIPGWTVQNGAGIEIQNNTVITAFDGDQYVELDSHPNDVSSTSNSSMFQLVDDLVAGQSYELSFAYAPRVSSTFDIVSGPTMNTNGINVYFGSQLELFNVDGVFTDTQSGWTIYSTIVEANAEEMYLMFEADGTSDTYGGFIDNVSLTSVPEPSILALFGLGLAGLGFASRKKNQA
jgi:hypothetical protein